ncbi:MAG TPA: YciI family protein [Flavobacteriales bacterium]|nr:YciI family protein [Flavobacteriales bacterium]
MKKSLITPVVFSLLLAACGETKQAELPDAGAKVETEGYDSALAARCGADEHGMRKYVMAFLVRGDSTITDSVKKAELMSGHLKNIGRMADEGKLAVAGPFLDDQPIRGIYIFNVETVEEAKALTETDPAIKAGTLKMELHPWYGSAALFEVNRLHNKMTKESLTH